jgi:hypothetical protein
MNRPANPALRGYGARALALLLPVALIGLAWSLLAAPLIGLFDGFAQQRADLQTVIAADRRVIAAAPAWEAALARLRAADAAAPGARTEPSAALAAAGLQNDVQAIVAQEGGQIITVEPLAPAIQNDLQAISIRVSLSLPAPALADFLRLVETHVPFMLITAAALQTADPGFDPATDATGPLTVQCTITAYRQP